MRSSGEFDLPQFGYFKLLHDPSMDLLIDIRNLSIRAFKFSVGF